MWTLLIAMIEWVPYGPHALLLRFASEMGPEAFDLGRAILAAVRRNPQPGLIECVPGFTTLLMRFDSSQSMNLPMTASRIAHQLSALSPASAVESELKAIPVNYKGLDLQPLADAKGLSVQELIQLHCEPVYRVYMLGFSPGFPYLGELNPRLHTPRRATPRPKVAAGSVAIGGQHTGIYTVDSPGGWHIVGHTTVNLFDRSLLRENSRPEEVFFLSPGDRVRFVPIMEASS